MRQQIHRGRFALLLAALGAALISLTTAPGAQQNVEWRTFSGDNRGWRYSPIDQINKDNIRNLKIVWRRSSMPEEIRPGRSTITLPEDYQTTPLMVGNIVYMKAADGSVVALHPATGATLWSHVPREVLSTVVDPNVKPNIVTTGASRLRGLAYWGDGRDARIITTFGPRLAALDARTGEPIRGFGTDGSVDLTKGYRTPMASHRWGAPPLIVKDVIVVAGVPSNADRTSGPGDIRGFDVRTGKQLWRFNVIPDLGEPGSETWLDNSNTYSGAGGAWNYMSADDELGYVYIPTEDPTARGGGDFYGAARPGNNEFADSVLCLDAKTGKRVWHFQVIHHSLWDWDLNSAPNVIDITVDGRKIKAVTQLSKLGYVYTFDRVTGRPVWPIVEQRVPKGNVPGEWYPPTQPVPTKPAPIDIQGVSFDNLIDFTPELRAEAVRIVNQYHYATNGPWYPPTVAHDGKNGTIQMPGAMGGPNWPGGGFDPDTGMLYVPSSHTPFIAEMVKPTPPAAARDGAAPAPAPEWTNKPGDAITGPWLIGSQGLPVFKPPWGRLVAVDMNSGDIQWTVANGNGPRDHPALKGVPNLPKQLGQAGHVGPLVTKTLLFLGEGTGHTMRPGMMGGKMFRAYDKATGDIVHEMELPGATSGPPITYLYNGKQYIVVATSFRGVPGEIIALALP